MGIDAKDVCVIVWKVIRFSTNTTCRYVKRYPVASCVSAFVIFLYTFLPRIFYVMLCSSPLIACAFFYLRNHLSGGEEEEERTDRGGLSEGRTEKAELKHQRSVRRNARREVEEVGKDWDSSQASEDERGKVIMTTLYGELPPETTIAPDLEAFKRDRTLLAAEERFVQSNLDNEDYVVVEDPLERVTSVCDGETELECSSSSSSSEEEEEREKETNKVIVAWTEDDQKNLMDLGTSEIERNKRLENLITRRRSRRFFLLAAERSLMDMEVPRICIGRNNYYGFDRENYETDGVIMPGSAPSVMLPRRNPFDLPYDPHEERPNLTGDSFQQEFADANPKDIFYSRHESFHYRIFPSESQNDSKLESLWRKTVDGRPKPLQGSNDQLPVMKESDVEAGEVRIETDSIRNNDDDSDSNTTLSPRERERDFSVSDLSDASETFCKRNEDRAGKSFPGLAPRSGGGSGSLANARQRYVEHFGYSIKRSHVTTHSVDSDLQVEVSELGSPPSSVDGNDSSDEERSLFINESEISMEMGFNEMLPVGKVEQDLNETKSLASPEVNEEAGSLEPMDLKNIPGNSAEEPESSERTHQEFEEPCDRNDQEVMQQQLPEAETSDANDHGNSEDSATSPTSVLQDMLPLNQTHSEDLDHSSDGLRPAVDPTAESSSNQSNEHSDPTRESTAETICLDATETVQEKQEGSEEPLINDESRSAEGGHVTVHGSIS